MKKYSVIPILIGGLLSVSVAHAESNLETVAQNMIVSGKIIPCDSPDNSCKNNDLQHQIYYSSDKNTAIVWTFGYPSEGTAHYGNFSEFDKKDGEWSYIQTYKKPLADFPAPKQTEIKFINDKVKVTYNFKKPTDPNCCATGKGTATLTLHHS